ncbi:MAG: FAD-dependent oxidoreductase [Pseudomonadota bacterium]
MAEAGQIAVIGAGIAGLACADRLRRGGHAPIVFDKSRGLGGRLATRRILLDDAREVSFDHGAQYATCRSDAFSDYLERAAAAGSSGAWATGPDGAQAGMPGMSALVRPLAEGLTIRSGVEIRALSRVSERWHLETAEGREGPFDTVISTAPAPQTARLFAEAAGPVRDVVMAPCWALMAVFGMALDLPDHLTWRGQPLSWAARNGSKPGRMPGIETWVVHASPDWSTAHLEREREAVVPELLGLFAEVTGMHLPAPLHARAHRWRYARTLSPLGRPFFQAGAPGLYAAGGWCIGARVEDAFLSGLAAAEAVLEQVPA